MDINDYNTRLSQARINYRDAADELKENYNSDLDSIQRNNKGTQKKQRETYETSKEKFEADVASSLSKQNKKIKKSMQEKTEEYRNKTASQRDNFEEDRQNIQSKFENRLDYLRDSYSKDLSSRKKTQDVLLSSSTERYNDKSDENIKDFQQSISKLDGLSVKALKDQKKSHETEKRSQDLSHSNEIQDIVTTGNTSRNKIVERNQRNLQNLRNTQSDELNQLNHHQEQRILAIHDQKDKESKLMTSNFRELTDDLSLRNDKNNARISRNNREEITKLEREFSQTIYQNKRELQEKLKGGTELDKDDIKSAKLEQNFTNRIKSININIDDMRRKDQLDKERMSESFQNSVKERNLSHAKKIDGIENESRNFKNNTVKDIKDNTNKILDSYRKRISQIEIEGEQKTVKSRQSSNLRLRNQKEEFGRVVKKISDMNEEAISKIQNEHAIEQTDFIELSRKNHHKDIESLKDEFNKRMENKETSLNQRLAQKEKELFSTVEHLEDKLTRSISVSEKKISSMKNINEERRTEDAKEFKRSSRKLLNNFEKEKVSMKDQFDKHLSKSKHQNDVKLNNIVQKYETQLEVERNDTRRHFKTKIKQLESNYERLADQSELEKDLIRNQFERRIEDLKQINTMKLDEISRSKSTDNA